MLRKVRLLASAGRRCSLIIRLYAHARTAYAGAAYRPVRPMPAQLGLFAAAAFARRTRKRVGRVAASGLFALTPAGMRPSASPAGVRLP